MTRIRPLQTDQHTSEYIQNRSYDGYSSTRCAPTLRVRIAETPRLRAERRSLFVSAGASDGRAAIAGGSSSISREVQLLCPTDCSAATGYR